MAAIHPIADHLQALPDPGSRPEHEPVDLRPRSAYEAVTRQIVESLADDLRDIKNRLNGLIFTIVGAIMLDLISRLASG